MSKYIPIIILILIQKIILLPSCEEGKNNCLKCNYINKLCVKCNNKDLLSPDENGGCVGSKKCAIGKNYCNECSEEGDLCNKCEEGYFQDENGGCSYSDNCEISFKGECIKCKKDFILTGNKLDNDYLLCKSLDTEDLKNCEEININNGTCSKCKEGFYLNKGDNRCTEIKNCYESSFGICNGCIPGYYFDTKNNKCKKQEESFIHCKKTLDGKICDICEDNYYLTEDGECSETNFCSKINLDNGKCEKCISKYYLSKFNSYCISTDNCYLGDKDTGLCLSCTDNYYLDYKDGKCKSNTNNNKYIHCRYFNGTCKECAYNYYLDGNSKCTSTKNCANSENGKCHTCSNKYYLTLDDRCISINNCIYSNKNYECIECEDSFYYNVNKKLCISVVDKNFENCKISDCDGKFCEKCKNGFYLNIKDHVCYNNTEIGTFYGCEETDKNGEFCEICEKGFYHGKKYKKCSEIEGCENISDEKKCEECNENYVLDIKTGKCEINNKIINEDTKFYYKCNKTNENGNECEICISGKNLDDNGLCVDNEHCIKEKNDVCKKCGKKDNEYLDYCLNSEFGCVETYAKNCLECNDILNFNNCTKCNEGYELNEENICMKME